MTAHCTVKAAAVLPVRFTVNAPGSSGASIAVGSEAATVTTGVAVPSSANVAVQILAPSTWTVVVAIVPLHAPPQPENVYPASGAAVKDTVVALSNNCWHAVPPVPHAIVPPVTIPPVGAGLMVMEYPGFRPPTSCVQRLLNEPDVPISQRGCQVLAARRGLKVPISFVCDTDVTMAASPSGVPSPAISNPTSWRVFVPCVTRKKLRDSAL